MESTRPAEPQDIDRLLELAGLAREELLLERGGTLWAERESPVHPRRVELLDAMTDTDRLLVLGCVEEYPAGFGLIGQQTLRNGDKLAVVSDIYVEPGFRGVSVGEAVMTDLMAWARDRGCIGVDSLVLPGMRDSKNFFERFTLKARALIVHHSFAEPPEPPEPPEPSAEPHPAVEADR
ncbi:MAG: N-acetyltransferase family protein [Acidimicrobiales bacterium]